MNSFSEVNCFFNYFESYSNDKIIILDDVGTLYSLDNMFEKINFLKFHRGKFF